MSEGIKHVVLVSASPKVDQDWAVSNLLAKRGEAQLKCESLDVTIANVRHAILHHETEPAFDTLQNADAIVLIFPLYFFCMPGMLTRFLQDFAAKEPKTSKSCAVYAIVNCGFPEPEINLEAMRVVELFARKTGRFFGGGVMIGCGGMIIGTQTAPFMRPIFEQVDSLFARVKENAFCDEPIKAETCSVAPKFPRKLYFLAGNAGWLSTARKNKLKRKDLNKTPYKS